MTFDSSNREWIEKTNLDSLISDIRGAMEAGSIRPAHTYDEVDELICRAEKMRLAIIYALKDSCDTCPKFFGCVHKDDIRDRCTSENSSVIKLRQAIGLE